MFLRVVEGGESIQVSAKKNQLAPELFSFIRSLDVGDFVRFSELSFLGVNFMIVSLIAGAVWLARSTLWGRFLPVAVFTQFALHGLLVHPVFSLWKGALSPGFVSGVAILLPLASVGFWWAADALPRRLLLRGMAAGVLLFASQDLWRVIFNSLLHAPDV